MSDLDTKERLARLRECFPDNVSLAHQLGCDAKTIAGVAGGSKDLADYPDLSTKIDRLHEQIQKEHAAGLDAISYAMQLLEAAEAGTLTEEKIQQMRKILEGMTDDLNTAHA
jgi:hypothetical protein